MHLSGHVPQRIQKAMADERARNAPDGVLRGRQPEDYGIFAVHAGGKAILDAVETGLELAKDRLDWSRGVLKDFGNMSSATVMFVLQRIMAGIGSAVPRGTPGFAVAFGPGLAAESFRFTAVG